MTKIVGRKLKMTEIYKDDSAFGVTPIAIAPSDDITPLKIGDRIKVSGTYKGKGFQGVVKRHGFSGGPKTHGQKNRHRAPGSIGNTTPQRVIPGRRMAGRMGGVRVTTKNIEIIAIDAQKKIISLWGAVPGPAGSRVELRT